MDLSQLSEPFEPKDLEWRAQRDGKGRDGKPWVMCVCYVDNRAIMNRLDRVVGPENWRNEFRTWEVGGKHGVLCGLSIRIVHDVEPYESEWVTKWDGADPTDIEPIKGGLSDSMKRAAVQWGIGRYLYEIEANFGRVVDGKQEGAKQAGKGADAFWWMPPTLPASALPKKPAPAAAKPAAARPGEAKPPTVQASDPVDAPAATFRKPEEGKVTPEAINKLRDMAALRGLAEGQLTTGWDLTVAAYKKEFERIKALPRMPVG